MFFMISLLGGVRDVKQRPAGALGGMRDVKRRPAGATGAPLPVAWELPVAWGLPVAWDSPSRGMPRVAHVSDTMKGYHSDFAGISPL